MPGLSAAFVGRSRGDSHVAPAHGDSPLQSAMLRSPRTRRSERNRVIAALTTVAVIAGLPGPAAGQTALPENAVCRFEQVCFDDFSLTQPCPDRDALRRLLAEVPGESSRIDQTRRHDQAICRVSGLLKLGPSWTENSALRLWPVDSERFRIHVCAGREGVTLHYHRQPTCTWAGYLARREGVAPRPEAVALVATDQGRYRRTGLGAIAIYHHAGSLILARGDVRLLTVPLAARPEEILLEGTAQIRGLEMFRVRGAPHDDAAPPPSADAPPPAERTWQRPSGEGIALDELAGGAVELAAAENTGDGHAWTSVCQPGLHEFLVEIESPSPGTGVMLCDDAGKPRARLCFFRDRRTGRTTFGLARGDSRGSDRSHDGRRPLPLAGPRHWFRIVAGGSVARLLISGDGRHWSQATPEVVETGGPCTAVGLFCEADDQPRSVRLRHLSVHRLEAIEGLVRAGLLERVAAAFDPTQPDAPQPLEKSTSFEDWRRRCAETRPADETAESWRRACLVHTLARGPAPWWAQHLPMTLAEEALDEMDDPRACLRLLDELGLLLNARDWATSERWVDCYERVGRRVEHRRDGDGYALVHRRFVQAPFWPERDLPPAWSRLAWWALVRASSAHQWDAAAELSRRLRFRSRPEQAERRPPPWGGPLEHVLRYVEDRASTRQVALAPDRPGSEKHDYRHPAIEHWGKEGYNVGSELKAALAAGALPEACQVIASATPAATRGLLPDASDPDLQVTLSGVIEQAVDASPELRKTMREQYGGVARLRLARATQAGDEGAVEMVSLQFMGTGASVDAHRWLGDRRMASGRFAEAAGLYRRAMRRAGEDRHADLACRLRLALAVAGGGRDRDATHEVPAAGFRPGQRDLSGDELAEILAELSAASPPRTVAGARDMGAGAVCPAPARCTVRPLAELAGLGKKPAHFSSNEIDWAGRETAAIAAGVRLIATARAEHVGLGLETGKAAWRHLTHIASTERPWPLFRSPAVVHGDHVLVRRASDGGSELVCLESVGGRLRWSGTWGDRLASDALLVGQRGWAFSSERSDAQKTNLVLTQFDLTTGRALRRSVPVELRRTFRLAVPCGAVAAGDRIVAAVAGAVVCCDLEGRTRWLRRQAWIVPPGVAFYDSRAWLQQRRASPIVSGERVYVTQPGTWSVEAVDLQTGRLAWRTTLSELIGLVGMARGVVIAETVDGFVGLRAESGEVAWAHDAPQRLEGRLCGRPGGLLYACAREAGEKGRKEPRVVLVWVEPEQGKAVAEETLDLPPHPKPLLGPLGSDGARLWAFYGSGEDSPRRQIFEIVLEGRTDPPLSE